MPEVGRDSRVGGRDQGGACLEEIDCDAKVGKDGSDLAPGVSSSDHCHVSGQLS